MSCNRPPLAIGIEQEQVNGRAFQDLKDGFRMVFQDESDLRWLERFLLV